MSEPDLVVETTEEGKFVAGMRAEAYMEYRRVRVEWDDGRRINVTHDVFEKEIEDGDLRIVE